MIKFCLPARVCININGFITNGNHHGITIIINGYTIWHSRINISVYASGMFRSGNNSTFAAINGCRKTCRCSGFWRWLRFAFSRYKTCITNNSFITLRNTGYIIGGKCKSIVPVYNGSFYSSNCWMIAGKCRSKRCA